MSFEPVLWATFCDDDRQEVGSKLSYMGVYGPNLIVQSFPTQLLKFCCIFSLRVPLATVPQLVVFKLLHDEEVLFESEVVPPQLAEPAEAPSAIQTEPRIVTISAVAQLVGFEITQRSVLKARAVVDGQELHGGAVEVLAEPSLH